MRTASDESSEIVSEAYLAINDYNEDFSDIEKAAIVLAVGLRLCVHDIITTCEIEMNIEKGDQ